MLLSEKLLGYNHGCDLVPEEIVIGDLVFDANGGCHGKVVKIARVNLTITTNYIGKPMTLKVPKSNVFYVIRNMTIENDWLSGTLHGIQHSRPSNGVPQRSN